MPVSEGNGQYRGEWTPRMAGTEIYLLFSAGSKK